MSTAAKTPKPFGLWSSPIRPESLALQLRLNDVQWDSGGRNLVWAEERGEKGVLVGKAEGGAPRDLSGDISVHGGLFYGGGEFTVHDGLAVFAAGDGRLYRRPLDYGQPQPITPGFGKSASPAISPDGRWVLYVHSVDGQDSLAIAPTDGGAWPAQVARGADFYMQPCWSPNGSMVAWVEYDQPNMPWDGGRLMLAGLDGDPPRAERVIHVDGGEDTPVFQPAFSPDGRWLSYIIGDGELDRLALYHLADGATHTLAGAVLLPPAWVQGKRVYGWSRDGKRIYFIRNDAGFFTLWGAEVSNGKIQQLATAPYTWLDQLSVSTGGERLAFLASAPGIPTRIAVWEGGQLHTERYSDPETVDPLELSTPQAIDWQAPDGAMVHGLYYPPASARFYSEGLPPAVVYVHGGPTSQFTSRYSPEAVFFTTRGYAFLAVNYRGSTGYGRSYRLALREQWGNLDVMDTVAGAGALVERGLADPKRLVVMGGSAGGFTALNCLIRHPGLFKAGVEYYGVSSLMGLSLDTHKFEEHINDRLVGVLPGAAQRYHDWSPVYFADRIQDALAIFQGSEDRVVPPEQSEAIARNLRERGVPHLYKVYTGEGHGWRKPETIADFYRQIERFLLERVIYSA
jgi:dipeptidyl aminopeptidase/acylaminoacyl peptidase